MHPVAKVDGLPGFTGGLVGWFGFESIQYVEPRFADGHARDELGTPDLLLILSEEVAVFDNLKGRLDLAVHADPGEPQERARARRRQAALRTRPRPGPPG